MVLRSLSEDERGYMVNIGALMIVGYGLIMLAVISFWFDHLGWFQGGIWETIFGFSPMLVGGGVMLIFTRWNFDPRWIVILGMIAAATFYVLVIP